MEVDMNAKIFIAVIAIFALALPSLTIAGHHYGGHGCMSKNWDMTALDTDNDGVLTFEEFSAPNMKKWRSGFNMIDTNGDGEVGAEEWGEFSEAHGMKSDQ